VRRHQRAPGLVLARLRWPDGGPEGRSRRRRWSDGSLK
jgi:hypothetical protein